MGSPAITEPAKTEWSEEEYLAGIELDPEIKYGYVRGRVYAMATPTAAHAEISSNIFVPLHTLLKGKVRVSRSFHRFTTAENISFQTRFWD